MFVFAVFVVFGLMAALPATAIIAAILYGLVYFEVVSSELLKIQNLVIIWMAGASLVAIKYTIQSEWE